MVVKQISNSARSAIWQELRRISTRGKLAPGDRANVAEYFGVRWQVIDRIWKRGCESVGNRSSANVESRAKNRGRKKFDRIQTVNAIREIPATDRTSQRRIEAAAAIPKSRIHTLVEEGFLRRARQSTRPLSTQDPMDRRVEFCSSFVHKLSDNKYAFSKMNDVIHIDEKWFFLHKVGHQMYLVTDKADGVQEDPQFQFVQGKSHIVKVMFLCAVARPRDDWDGKIGIWPLVEDYVTQRDNCNRPKGITIQKPVSVDREFSRALLMEKVIPAVKAKWPRHQRSLLAGLLPSSLAGLARLSLQPARSWSCASLTSSDASTASSSHFSPFEQRRLRLVREVDVAWAVPSRLSANVGMEFSCG
ncbi:TPA: hypothetical protein N0F65_004851 [Lagenidium giganteum]|uniref:DUF7769 domain-containing protein n=1 Tax=Lagenidium giganteum TaxID=4803 RepID=A0AAV2Z5C7_9STRA|nr:TPA: hypothetical protein N0F65_004851 [Lagenidium giganteum]